VSVAVDFGPLVNLAGFMLRLAQIRLFESFFRDFGARDLTPGQIGILVAVGRTPGVRQGVLAAALRIKRSNMAKIVSLLVRKGLLKRDVPESDRRAMELRLTQAGQALVNGIVPELAASDRAATANLNDRELGTLMRLLDRLAAPARAAR
jgi:DNA-binding MarR family transcriptional regulator